jgi:hypothetical protein
VTLPPGLLRKMLMSWRLVLLLEEQELRDHALATASSSIPVPDEDDPVLEQSAVDVVLALTAAGLLDDGRDEVVGEDFLWVHPVLPDLRIAGIGCHVPAHQPFALSTISSIRP